MPDAFPNDLLGPVEWFFFGYYVVLQTIYFVLAALASEPGWLRRPLRSRDTLLMAGGLHDAQRMWRQTIDKVMTTLGAMPTDQLVRHPFARNLYNMRMRNYIASLDADEITPEVMNAAAASARAFATKQVRRLLYNIADENQAIHMFRFVAPFFQAQMEVLERYAHLFTSQPESLVRFGQFYYLSQQGHEDRGLWYMVDADGNPTSRMSHDNKMVIQKTKFVESLMDKIPGLKNGGELAVIYCFVFLYFVFSGPGAWSLDGRRAIA